MNIHENRNMNNKSIEKIFERAINSCSRKGVRFTQKRKNIFEILLISKKPLSAYQIADAFNNTFNDSIPVMSVYRILDFLEKHKLVHKLNSNSKYVACSDHLGSCDHEIPQYLICSKCEGADEFFISKSVLNELINIVVNTGYSLDELQLELKGVCNNCSTREDRTC